MTQVKGWNVPGWGDRWVGRIKSYKMATATIDDTQHLRVTEDRADGPKVPLELPTRLIAQLKCELLAGSNSGSFIFTFFCWETNLQTVH